MRISLDVNSLKDYQIFLKVKSLPRYSFEGRVAVIPDEYAALLGEPSAIPLAAEYIPIPGLFDYQADIAALAIAKRKFAVFAECFLPGSLVMAADKYRAIEECQEGMAIETLTGPASIEQTMSRPYDGETVVIKTASGFFPLSVTPNHQFYVLRRQRCTIPARANTLCSPACEKSCTTLPHKTYAIELRRADELTTDDCLLFRQPRESQGFYVASDEELKIAGYWLAEGHLSRQDGKLYGIHFGFHANERETLVSDVVRTFAGTGIRARVQETKLKNNTLVVSASNHMFATWLSRNFGERSHAKHLPDWFRRLSRRQQLILLSSLFEGDACIRTAPPSSHPGGRLSQHIKFVTVSRDLAMSVRDALLSLGIRCSASVEKAKMDRNGVNHREAYRLLIPRRFMAEFGYPVEVIRRDIKQVEHTECGQTYTLIPIRELSRGHYSGIVYNLTSSGHDSYLTEAGTSKNCGLGKTLILTEFARHAAASMAADRCTLIVSPLMVIPQTIAEVERFYGRALPIEVVKARDLPKWTKTGSGIGITNYDALTEDVPQGNLGSLILDESSMLKSAYGKWAGDCIRLGKGLEWKLALTGTPAPNDRIEYANHAVFLDAFPTVKSFLARFFVNRGQMENRWELKPHALRPFYRALSHWCIFLTNPATYGWKDNAETVPPIHVHVHDVELTEQQQSLAYTDRGTLFAMDPGGITSRSVLSQIAKGNHKGAKVDSLKPRFIRDLVDSWPDESTIIWCHYNEEQKGMAATFTDAANISGDTSPERRQELIEDFKSGRRRVMISKPRILGFGLNLQVATRQVFSGLQDSYEEYHQAVKRSNRVGSTRPLNVHIPITEIERPMIETVIRKANRVQQDTEIQERLFKEVSGPFARYKP